jgi:hypothetical protein
MNQILLDDLWLMVYYKDTIVIRAESAFSMNGLCNVSSEGDSRTRKLLAFLDKLNLTETRVTTGLQSTQLEINRRESERHWRISAAVEKSFHLYINLFSLCGMIGSVG